MYHMEVRVSLTQLFASDNYSHLDWLITDDEAISKIVTEVSISLSPCIFYSAGLQ